MRKEEYKSIGFLSYLLRKSEELRIVLLQEILTFYDLRKTEIMCLDEKKNDYEIIIYESNGNKEYFEMTLFNGDDDLVCYLSIRSKDSYYIDKQDVYFHYHFYIHNHSDQMIFYQFLIKDTDLKKIVYYDEKQEKLREENEMEFHCSVSLDYIDDMKIDNDFVSFMYLLKKNKPYDSESSFIKKIIKYHESYLKEKSLP